MNNEHAGSDGGLSVLERVEAAIAFLASDTGGRKLSVSAVCRAAGVSRANLYSSHPEIVKQIVGPKQSLQESTNAGDSRGDDEALSGVNRCASGCEDRYRALLTVCLEQQAEINFLRLKLEKRSGREEANTTKSQRKRRS
ncbi:hypothetical protein R75461_05012 [Paraburkholderia nemoris]|nr:hypothetical protein R75461_05012 [Paraburkholderia nemoris]